MLKHIVLFKLKDNYSNEQKASAIAEIAEALKELPKKIQQIKKFEVGVNIADRTGGAELGLVSEFKNTDDLLIYREHPEHLKIMEIIKKHKEFSIYLDY